MDPAEMRSPLQTKNPNIMVSKLRPPSAIKRPYVRDSQDDVPKQKIPKCDLSVTRPKQEPTLRRQTVTAAVRRPPAKKGMPPPDPPRSTLRRQTSNSSTMKRSTSKPELSTASRTGIKKKPPVATRTATTAAASKSKTATSTVVAASKRPKWDYKGRVEDMEELMKTVSRSLNSNKERIEFLESINQKLEKNNEQETLKYHEMTTKCLDIETENRGLHEELSSLKQKHDFETEIKDKKIKDLMEQLRQVEGDLTVARSETNALKSTIATMTAQSYGIQTELEAMKLNLQNVSSKCSLQEQRIQQQSELICKHENTIAQKDSQLRDQESQRRILHNTIQELKGNIRVFCRVRPALSTENNSALANFSFCDEQRVTVEQSIAPEDVTGSRKTAAKYDFQFDKIFQQSSNQETIFKEISQLVQSALDGYNVCIFAYGQTGSGKTFTMEGEQGDNRGMIPRSMEHVFATAEALKEKGWKYDMKASLLEIYNENIRDLLTSDETLKYDIKMAKDNDVMVTNLKIVDVLDENQVFSLLKTASQNRAVAATKCNERSSRSHSVFSLKLTGVNTLTDEKCQGTLNLVDLAGSERLSQSGAEGKRLKETKNINSSLSNLSNVIMALANKESHIPYRNSKLTYLLKNSLGGNSKSLMFVNVSPREDSFQETLCSLRFATKVNNCNIGTAQKKVVK